jgi:hypothetical protein
MSPPPTSKASNNSETRNVGNIGNAHTLRSQGNLTSSNTNKLLGTTLTAQKADSGDRVVLIDWSSWSREVAGRFVR